MENTIKEIAPDNPTVGYRFYAKIACKKCYSRGQIGPAQRSPVCKCVKRIDLHAKGKEDFPDSFNKKRYTLVGELRFDEARAQ